jgi:hypothetical protein
VFLEGFQAVCRADYGVVDCRAAGRIGGDSKLGCHLERERRLRKTLGNWVFSITNSFPLVALRRIIWQQGCAKVYALPDAIAEPLDD